jgi:hypothetical protein
MSAGAEGAGQGGGGWAGGGQKVGRATAIAHLLPSVTAVCSSSSSIYSVPDLSVCRPHSSIGGALPSSPHVTLSPTPSAFNYRV